MPLLPRAAILRTPVDPAYTFGVGSAYTFISTGYETYYALVEAADPKEAVAMAQRQAVAAQEGIEIEPDDFHPLLVTSGHHDSEALFNK